MSNTKIRINGCIKTTFTEQIMQNPSAMLHVEKKYGYHSGWPNNCKLRPSSTRLHMECMNKKAFRPPLCKYAYIG